MHPRALLTQRESTRQPAWQRRTWRPAQVETPHLHGTETSTQGKGLEQTFLQRRRRGRPMNGKVLGVTGPQGKAERNQETPRHTPGEDGPQKSGSTGLGEGVGKLGARALSVGRKLVPPLQKQCGGSPKNQTGSPCDPVSPRPPPPAIQQAHVWPGCEPRRTESRVSKRCVHPTFTLALFTSAKTSKNPESVDRCAGEKTWSTRREKS